MLNEQCYPYTHKELWQSQVYRTLSTYTDSASVIHLIAAGATTSHWQTWCIESIRHCIEQHGPRCIHLVCACHDTHDHAVIEEWVREYARQIAPFGHRINGIADLNQPDLVAYLLSDASRFLSGAFFDVHGVMIRNGCSVAERMVAQSWYLAQRTYVS